MAFSPRFCFAQNLFQSSIAIPQVSRHHVPSDARAVSQTVDQIRRRTLGLPGQKSCNPILHSHPASLTRRRVAQQLATTTRSGARGYVKSSGFPKPNEKKLRQRLALPNGQVVYFDEVGKPNGLPVFYLHGFPNSGAGRIMSHPIFYRQGIRLISPDRPGFGMSSPWLDEEHITASGQLAPGFFGIHEYPKQIAAIAYRLGLGRFGVIGVSGGGPYAISCANSLQRTIDAYTTKDLHDLITINLAYESGREPTAAAVKAAMPQRKPVLSAVGISVGSAPFSFRVAGGKSPSSAFTVRMTAYSSLVDTFSDDAVNIAREMHVGFARAAERQLTEAAKMKHTPEAPKYIFDRIEGLATHFAVMQQDGVVADWLLRNNWEGWGFNLEDVKFKAANGSGIKLFYASDDVNVPAIAGRYLEKRLKGSKLEIARGFDHHTVNHESMYAEIIKDMGEDPVQLWSHVDVSNKTRNILLNLMVRKCAEVVAKDPPAKRRRPRGTRKEYKRSLWKTCLYHVIAVLGRFRTRMAARWNGLDGRGREPGYFGR